MSNIVNITDFVGRFSIPNIEKDTTSFDNNYIAVYEPEILKRLLGVGLYNDFIQGLAAQTPEQKWIDLRDGKTYLVDGVTVEWSGVKKLIVPYVYYFYLQQNYNTLSGVGVINSNAENATKTDPNIKLVDAWNECVNYSGNYKAATTSELMPINYVSFEDTIFNFIVNHYQDYINWIYTPIESINYLGI